MSTTELDRQLTQFERQLHWLQSQYQAAVLAGDTARIREIDLRLKQLSRDLVAFTRRTA